MQTTREDTLVPLSEITAYSNLEGEVASKALLGMVSLSVLLNAGDLKCAEVLCSLSYYKAGPLEERDCVLYVLW